MFAATNNSKTSNLTTKSRQTAGLVPYVVKKTVDGERGMDIFSRLLDDRIIMLTEGFEDSMAANIVAQLLYLESVDAKKDITMYINSPGGSVSAMWSIIDTMNLIKCDVSTVCIGMAASAGSLALAAGVKGKRFILPNAEVMIHQPSFGTQGMVSDVEIAYLHGQKTKDKLHKFLAERCNQDIGKVTKDMDRDTWLDADEALAYGIVDKIIQPKSK
jgi:ATP-dependent Clp protease, protease subunit